MPALKSNQPLSKQPILRSAVVPEVKTEEAAVEKTYKIRFGAFVERCDKVKEESFVGLQYMNQSYGSLMIIQALGKPILDEALSKLETVMLEAGFQRAELICTPEEKAVIQKIRGGK